MTDPSQLPATRTSLLQLRRQLAETRQGYDLLERKREVLLHELWGLFRELRDAESRVRARFEAAYRAQLEARLTMGMERMRWAALAPPCRTLCSVRLRSVMGVPLPVVDLKVEPLPLPYSPAGVSVAFDRASRVWTEVGEVLGPWIEAAGSFSLVSSELAKTQRRVSALKNLVIPRYEGGISRIQAVLDEQDREGFVRSKRAKDLQKPFR